MSLTKPTAEPAVSVPPASKPRNFVTSKPLKLKVYKYGEKVLREKATPVAIVDDRLRKLADDMIEAMHESKGVGLAAEQVGRLERMCVIDIPDGCEEPEDEVFNAPIAMPLKLFNPEIVAQEGSQRDKEGCLSFPNVGGSLTRAAQVTCQYLDEENRPQITQYVIETEREKKYEHLLYLLDSDAYQRVMVFINTKDMTQRICKRLQDAGYQAECLHGDMRQGARNQVMQGYRKGKFQILLATDVAARGIDVDDVEAVINYDLPNENEYYTHRIGRTGRAKRQGVAFTLMTYSETIRLDEILKYIKAEPVPLKFDTMGVLTDAEGKPFFDNI